MPDPHPIASAALACAIGIALAAVLFFGLSGCGGHPAGAAQAGRPTSLPTPTGATAMNATHTTATSSSPPAGDDVGGAPTAHVPAAFTPQRAMPKPIAFPDRLAAAEAAGAAHAAVTEATRRRWERQAQLIDAAKADGFARGLQDGYTSGVRWGLVCGGVAGMLGMAVVWWATAAASGLLP